MREDAERSFWFYRFCLAALTALGPSGAALAQDSPKHLTLIGIPSGTVAPHGTFFASVALTNRRYGVVKPDNDGSLALGFGLGSAEESIGFQFTASIDSLSRSFGDAGSLSLKASRRIAAGEWNTYLGVSLDYLAPWGAVKGRKPAVTAALSSFGLVPVGDEMYPVMLTVGGGSRIRNNDRDPGMFAGVGLGLTQSFAVSAAVSGDGLDLGVGYKPSGIQGLEMAFAVNDVTQHKSKRQVTLTATWAISNVFGR